MSKKHKYGDRVQANRIIKMAGRKMGFSQQVGENMEAYGRRIAEARSITNMPAKTNKVVISCALRASYSGQLDSLYSSLSKAKTPRVKGVIAQGDQVLKDFYRSPEWIRLSYDVKKERGRRCECCGAAPEHGARIITDHIKPIRKHWHLRLERSNLQILCDDCNLGKGSRDETDFRQREDEVPEGVSSLLIDQLTPPDGVFQ